MGIVLGYVKRAHSDGSSPVTTTPFIVSFLVTTGFISMQVYLFVHMVISVRENRYNIFVDY